MQHDSRPRDFEGKLVGADDTKRWRVRAIDGSHIDLKAIDAIFPIIKRPRDHFPGAHWDLVGTGFYISTHGIFVTAKHVLYDVFDGTGYQTDAIALIHFLPNDQYLLRPILRAWHHGQSDLSVGIAAPVTHNITKEYLTNTVMTLTAESPPIGSVIGTYAYPDSLCYREGPTQHLKFSANFYSGEIVEAHPNGRDRVLMPWPCYETNIHMHGGASGGPVFSADTGKVFAINSKSYSGASDISYVTRITEIMDGYCSDVSIAPKGISERISIRDLVKLGYIRFDPLPS